MLAQLRWNGVAVEKIEDYDYDRFAWITAHLATVSFGTETLSFPIAIIRKKRFLAVETLCIEPSEFSLGSQTKEPLSRRSSEGGKKNLWRVDLCRGVRITL